MAKLWVGGLPPGASGVVAALTAAVLLSALGTLQIQTTLFPQRSTQHVCQPCMSPTVP